MYQTDIPGNRRITFHTRLMRLLHGVGASACVSLRHLPDPLLPAAVGLHTVERMGFPAHMHFRDNLAPV